MELTHIMRLQFDERSWADFVFNADNGVHVLCVGNASHTSLKDRGFILYATHSSRYRADVKRIAYRFNDTHVMVLYAEISEVGKYYFDYEVIS